MATTTTNFGWDIPQSTDLVKDGATAIAALGQDIDTAFIDLKGGTTGQVLAKASGTDLDFSWVAQDDSNAIQNAIVDAKGDLIAATAADTPARLAVGTNGQVLTADSTAATGLKWATAVSVSTFSGCQLNRSSVLAVANDTLTAVTFDTETFDTDGYHSTVTDTSRVTIPTGKGGYYLLSSSTYWDSNSSGFRRIRYRINGSTSALNTYTPGTSNANSTQNHTVVNLAAGDYVEMLVSQNSGGSLNTNWSTDGSWSVVYLGA
jgi:hypothetical protein